MNPAAIGDEWDDLLSEAEEEAAQTDKRYTSKEVLQAVQAFIQKKAPDERKMMMKEGRLGYNPENDRYGLLVSDLWEHDGFHCGDTMEALVDGEWAQSRMEYGDDGWYLVGTPYRGDLENIRVRIDG